MTHLKCTINCLLTCQQTTNDDIYIWIKVSFSSINMIEYTPFKKSNATRLWSIISLLSWICIDQIRYPWKACLFALRLMTYLFGLFHWGVCRMSKLGGNGTKEELQNLLVSMGNVCYVLFRAFLLWAYARVPTAPGPIHWTKSSETKHHAEFQIVNFVMQFWNIYFLTLRLI